MRIVLRKPEWPNKVFHPASVRRGVAKLLARARKRPPKKTKGVSRKIPVALSLGSGGLSRGTVTCSGKDCSGKSKWHRRVLAGSARAA